MGMVVVTVTVRPIVKLYSVFVFALSLALQQSTALGLTTISPSPATSLGLGPSSGHNNEEPFTTNPPSPIGSLAPPPFSSPPEPPETDNGLAPSSPPSAVATEVPPVSDPLGNVPAVSPTLPPIATPIDLGPPPGEVVVHAPSPSQGNEPVVEPPILMPVAPAAAPSSVHPSAPVTSPPSDHPQHSSPTMAPEAEPRTPPVLVTSPPPMELGSNPPVPAVSSPTQPPRVLPFNHSPSMLPSHSVSPMSSLPPVFNWGNEGVPAVAPSTSQIPANNGSSHIAPAPSNLLPPKPHTNGHPPGLSPSPSPSIKKPYNPSYKPTSPAPAPSFPVSPPILNHPEPAGPPLPIRVYPHPGLPPLPYESPVSSPPAPIFLPISHDPPTPSPSQMGLTGNNRRVFPSMPPSESPKALLKPPLQAFPPPPPNKDCSTIVCTEPYTNTPPGSPCGCVLPIQVGLRLSVALYTFFPLVSELAQEISTGVFVRQSQVRIIGATAANQQPDKTIVLVDLVPRDEKFDNTFSFFTYKRFWNKQVAIQKAYFGDYEVLYVRYPGLPESPPSRIGIIDDGPYPGANNNGRKIKPLGVEVPKNQLGNKLSAGVIAVIVLSASLAVIFCCTAAWIFLFKRKDKDGSRTRSNPHALPPALSKRSGFPGSVLGSRDSQSSATLSFRSSIATYTGSARTFAASDVDKATDHFNASRVLGEGGFGRVYSGVLEDGTKVAVKVLKRDDQQGGREFLAEVEMLSRLHHRNLVKLIGICTEERGRCLVYELIPNGSVESHLHGVDKESAPLNWGARMKIALGSARGLAYLHEDSSPRVIHRDFKSSNILLEDDFTPKVSDFGLARAALEEENRHISTRVMGTFGYVAPEYAMTGHLLVKSDVYSYGVVLLELLTGRKPVDMSQPPGEENLVAWARPLLSSKESLRTIVDHSLGSDLPYDNVAKVAAIASMCVQPEVTNRPFMGEVVQALKLVCNEIEEANGLGSRASSRRDDLSIDMGLSPDKFLDQTERSQYSSVHSYGSDDLDSRGGLSVSELFTGPARVGTEQSESFRRHSSSGPLGGQETKPFWGRVRRYSGGSVSEHGVAFRLWPGSH